MLSEESRTPVNRALEFSPEIVQLTLALATDFLDNLVDILVGLDRDIAINRDIRLLRDVLLPPCPSEELVGRATGFEVSTRADSCRLNWSSSVALATIIGGRPAAQD